jgi:pilus assembly protein CpaE
VVTVFSPKGGVGVTTLATHLAASLARQTRSRVAIADFDGQGAAVAASMGMNPARSFANLATVERIDSAALQDVIVRHPSGVAILAQPEGVEDAQSLDPERAAGVLEVLAGMHDHVVVDAPHVFDGVALEVFDRSSTVLLVTDLTVGGLRAARRALDVFRRLNYLVVRERVQLVVNRAVDRSAITPKQVEETLAYPVSHVITNDYNAVREAVDLGRVLCSEASSSRMARDVDAMARRLSGDETGEEPVESTPTRRTGLRLFGKR